MKISKRISVVEPSATLAVTAKAKAMRAEGIDVLALSAGEPDFAPPAHVCAAAKDAVDRGLTKYTPVPGSPDLRQAVADTTSADYGIPINPGQVLVGAGGKQVLFNACAALLDPGDEVIIPRPYWVSYPDMIRFAGATPVPVGGEASTGYLATAAQIQAAITDATRMLILNSPANPTGASYGSDELRAIAEVLRAHPEIFVITDDIYGRLFYDGEFVSLAHQDIGAELMDRVMIATGVSKTYAMTGWRIGFGIGPEPLIAAMGRLQGACTSGANSLAQAAAVAALTGDQGPVEDMRRAFAARRDRMVQGLQGIPDLEIASPGGAFYAFPDVSAYFNDQITGSVALCEHLLESVHLAVVPGAAFGTDAHVRLSFACSEADIDEGIARLAKGLAQLR